MNTLKACVYRKIIPSIGSAFISRNKFINTIYYHDVVKGRGNSFMCINEDTFKNQMLYLIKCGYQTKNFVDLSTPENCKWKKNTLLITFDDGWISNYTMIYDFMKSHGLKYNIFLEVGKIGVDDNYLNWGQIKEMFLSGIVGFGAHTYSHSNMSDFKTINVEKEIYQANSVMQRELGFAPKDFCFPYGVYSPETLQEIIGLNVYDRIYTSDLRYSYAQNGTIIFGRNAISNDESFDIFQNKVRSRYNVLSLLKNILR